MLYYDSGGRGAESIKVVSQRWGGRVSVWAEARLCGSYLDEWLDKSLL